MDGVKDERVGKADEQEGRYGQNVRVVCMSGCEWCEMGGGGRGEVRQEWEWKGFA